MISNRCLNHITNHPREFPKKTRAMDPRTYQTRIFDEAKKRNTIAVLPTGSGKTFIAAMLAKHVNAETKNNGQVSQLTKMQLTSEKTHFLSCKSRPIG